MWSRPGGSGIVTETSTPRSQSTLEAHPAASEPDIVSGSRAAFSLVSVPAASAARFYGEPGFLFVN
jgi:hypothetical protein